MSGVDLTEVDGIDEGQEQYEQKYRSRVLKNLKQKAKDMGFALAPIAPAVQID